MEYLLTFEGLWSLLTLTALEIVLGIDNIVFISIVVHRLPEHQRAKARTLGLSLALIFRILLLLAISWIVHLTQPILTIQEFTLSYRDVILWAGGLFLNRYAGPCLFAGFYYHRCWIGGSRLDDYYCRRCGNVTDDGFCRDCCPLHPPPSNIENVSFSISSSRSTSHTVP